MTPPRTMEQVAPLSATIRAGFILQCHAINKQVHDLLYLALLGDICFCRWLKHWLDIGDIFASL
jgi:hypothetical protein